jgi:hypothetical protein
MQAITAQVASIREEAIGRQQKAVSHQLSAVSGMRRLRDLILRVQADPRGPGGPPYTTQSGGEALVAERLLVFGKEIGVKVHGAKFDF